MKEATPLEIPTANLMLLYFFAFNFVGAIIMFESKVIS